MTKILVVDDNEQNSDLLKDVLSSWDYEVSIAKHGLEVLPMTMAFNPDVILLDIMLPGMSGFEVCTLLRSNEKTKLLPIIMCSVLSDIEDRSHSYSMGADNYLTKPINYNELRNIIESIMAKKSSVDNMENRLVMFRMLLEIADNFVPDLKQRNSAIAKLCERVLAKQSLPVDSERVYTACCLLDLTKSIGQEDYNYLGELNCASWLTALLQMLESDTKALAKEERQEQLLKAGIYWEWQLITVARFCQKELARNKIQKNLLIDSYRKKLLEMGCERSVLELFEKLFVSEQMLSNIRA